MFQDRRDAGRQLGARLSSYRSTKPVVLALPRGGVPVAEEVALALDAPLDVLVARKVGAPGNAELAIGAVAGNITHLDEPTIGQLAIPRRFIDRALAVEQEEVRHREARFRQGREPLPVTGRTVILVDDGLATGATATAAIAALRTRQPARIVLAVPIAAQDTLERLRPLADEVVCLETPTAFFAVGQGYEDFRQTTDEEVRAILARSGPPTAAVTPPAA